APPERFDRGAAAAAGRGPDAARTRVLRCGAGVGRGPGRALRRPALLRGSRRCVDLADRSAETELRVPAEARAGRPGSALPVPDRHRLLTLRRQAGTLAASLWQNAPSLFFRTRGVDEELAAARVGFSAV